MWKRVLWIGIPVLALAVLWIFAQTRPVPVDVAEVGRGSIRFFVEEEGKTRVKERFRVSAPVSGRLLRVELEENDRVEAGDLVARIDPLPLKSAVTQTEAEIRALRERVDGVETKKPKPEEIERARILEDQATEALEVASRELERAKAAWTRLQKELERTRSLAEERLVSASELDAAVAAEAEAHEQVRAQEVRVKIARLAISSTRLNRTVLEARLHDFDWEAKAYEQQVAALEATLRKLHDDLARAEIRAPASGVVLRVLLESEQVVTAGTPILEIGDLGELEVEVDYLSEDVAGMRVGMKAEVFGRALGDRVLPARITRIHPSAFQKVSSLGVEQQRVKVILELDASEPTGLGDLHRVEARVILGEREDVVLVPEGALFPHRGGWYVFVVNAGTARLRAVEVGLRDGHGRFREVRDGLDAGALVVLHPGDALEDEARVEPLASPPDP